MSIYETTFIINPQTDDDSIDREVRSISDLITSNGGKIVHEDRMGTRRLAYPIKGLTQGYYTSVIFEGVGQILPVLDRHFKLGEAFIRHLTIRYEGDIRVSAEAQKPEVRTEKKEEKEEKVAPAEAKAVTTDETKPAEAESESGSVEEPREEQTPELVEDKGSPEPEERVSPEEEEL